MKAVKESVDLRDQGLPFNIWILERSENSEELLQDKWHEYAEIVYVISGDIDQRINGVTYKMGKGDLAFINGLDFHSIYFYPGTKARLLVIQMPPAFISLYYREPASCRVACNYFKGSEPSRLSAEIEECTNKMMDELALKRDAYGYYLASCVYKLLGIVFRNSQKSSFSGNKYIEQKLLLERISPALDYISRNFKSSISVTEVSSILGMCRQHFCKCFKKATAYTFTNYLNELRVLFARDLLLTTDLNITEIAYSAGFSSVSYFNRVFKRISGTAPMKFRRK